MANTKSSKKDLRRIAKRTVSNRAVRSALKTYVKKVRTSVATGNAEGTGVALNEVVSALDKAAQNGVIHKRQAARRKSRIAKAANAFLRGGGAAAVVAEPATPKKTTAKKAAPKKAAPKKAAEKPAPVKKSATAAAKKPAAKKTKTD